MPNEGDIVRNKRTGEQAVWRGGRPVPMGAPASPPAPPGVIRGAPDPYKEQDQVIQMDAAARAARTEQRDMSKDGLTTQKTALEIDKMQREAAAGPSAQAAEGERDNAAFLRRAMGANETYDGLNIGPRSYVGEIVNEAAPSLLNQLPEAIGNSPERQQADAAQLEFIAAILRADSGAAIPPEEIARAKELYFPTAGQTDPAVIEEKRAIRQRAIDGLRLSAGRLAGEVDKAPARTESVPPPVAGAGDGAQVVAAATEGQQVDDPTLTGIRNEYKARLQAKQKPGEIVQWLRSVGVTNAGVLRSAAAQAQDRIKTNRAVSEYSTQELDDTYVPLSATDQMMNSAGQSPAGAYMVGAADFLTGSNLDSAAGALGGNAERTRLGMNTLAAQNPTANAMGQISGGIMGALGGEAALARLGMAPGFARGVTADAAMGGFNGAGKADSGSRAMGAVSGAGMAAAGSAAGTGVMRGISRVTGPTGGAAKPLYDAGVRPTLGQRVADKGVVGRTVNATEEALQSVPIVGSAIRGARQEARDQFQIGAVNDALKEVGEQLPKGMAPGTAPQGYAQKTFDRVYAEARNGMRLVGDEELSNDLGSLSREISTLAEPSQKRFNAIFKNVVGRRVKSGELAGAEYKSAVSDIGKQIRALRNNPNGDAELATALQDLQSILDNAARRHSDPDAVKLLDAADAGYAKLVRIEEAAKRRGGEAGTFSPAGFDSAVQKTSGGTRSKAYLRGDALMQDYAAAGRSLEDKTPNSGTTDRALVAGGLGTAAAGYMEPSILTFLAAIGAAYAPGIRKGMQAAVAPAGPRRQAIAAQLKKRARLVGAAGGASAVAALPGTTPAQ